MLTIHHASSMAITPGSSHPAWSNLPLALSSIKMQHCVFGHMADISRMAALVFKGSTCTTSTDPQGITTNTLTNHKVTVARSQQLDNACGNNGVTFPPTALEQAS